MGITILSVSFNNETNHMLTFNLIDTSQGEAGNHNQPSTLEQQLDSLHRNIAIKNKNAHGKMFNHYSDAIQLFKDMDNKHRSDSAAIIGRRLKTAKDRKDALVTLIKSSSEKRENIHEMIVGAESQYSETLASFDLFDTDGLLDTSAQIGQTIASYHNEAETLANVKERAKRSITNIDQSISVWNSLKHKLTSAMENALFSEKHEHIKELLRVFMVEYADYVAVCSLGNRSEIKALFESAMHQLLGEHSGSGNMQMIKAQAIQYRKGIEESFMNAELK